LPAFTTTLLLPALLATAADALPRGDAPSRPQPVQLAQVTIEQRVIIRIPMVPPRGATRSSLSTPSAPEPPSMRWKEAKGPKCLSLKLIRGAHIAPLGGITMLTSRNERIRAHFDRGCRPADFFAGFYIEPHKDGALCAGRDTLHARNGMTCEIEKFSKLLPEPVDEDDR
jgi:hypothetical protein